MRYIGKLENGKVFGQFFFLSFNPECTCVDVLLLGWCRFKHQGIPSFLHSRSRRSHLWLGQGTFIITVPAPSLSLDDVLVLTFMIHFCRESSEWQSEENVNWSSPLRWRTERREPKGFPETRLFTSVGFPSPFSLSHLERRTDVN